MSDRELLELAAEAAGVDGDFKHLHLAHGNEIGISSPHHRLWNPLTDDGDALRLAVKLNLNISTPVSGINQAAVGDCHWISAENAPLAIEQNSGDPDAATRRAIVRAAAEIGRRMK